MMKRHFRFLFTAAMMLAVSAQAVQASDSTPKKFINFNVGKNISVNLGMRVGLDFATFGTDSLAVESGLRVTDGTLQGEIYYKENISFHFDVNLYGDSERDLYFRYKANEHTIKAGFFRDPSSLSLNTTQESYRFVARPTAASILMNDDRVFGLSYKYVNEKFYAEQAFFVSDGPDDLKLETKFEDMGVAGRWLFKPEISSIAKFHVGLNARYVNYDDPKTVTLAGNVANNFDDETNFLYAAVDYVKQDLSVGAEAMYVADKYFVRGEYTNRTLMKDRDDATLFAAQDDYSTLSAWQASNPIRSNNFNGAYVEGAYLVLGDRYIYDDSKGQVSTDNMRGALEVVARYECTLMNDITSGDVFVNNRFSPSLLAYDATYNSASVGGGSLHAATVGVNYYITRGVVAMVDYSYNILNNAYYENDKNISVAQIRLFIKF